jgi:hypothetical protein
VSEPKKPAFKDMSDLRAKLGLKPSQPEAPAAEAQEEGDEATQMVSAMEDEDVGQAPSLLPPTQPPVDADHPGFQSPSADMIASAPSPGAAQPSAAPGPGPLTPPPADALASPFGQALGPGDVGPLVAPPAGLEPSLGMGEATIAAFAPVQRTSRKLMLGSVVFATILSLGFGYQVGKINKDRILINKRIQDCDRVLKPIRRTVNKLRAIVPQMQRANPDSLDLDLAKKLAVYDGQLKVDELITDNLLLGPSLSSSVLSFSANANRFYRAARLHGKLTLKTHKKFLEDFIKSNKALASDLPLFVYHEKRDRSGKPPPGFLVLPAGPAVKKGKVFFLPVRTLSGQEREAELDRLIKLDKKQLVGASGPNVMELYSERIKELRNTAIALDKTMDSLVLRLKKEADRPPVYSL